MASQPFPLPLCCLRAYILSSFSASLCGTCVHVCVAGPMQHRAVSKRPLKILKIGVAAAPPAPAHPIYRILIKSTGGGLKSQTAQYILKFHLFPPCFHLVSNKRHFQRIRKRPNTSLIFALFPACFHLVSGTSHFIKLAQRPIHRQISLVSALFPPCSQRALRKRPNTSLMFALFPACFHLVSGTSRFRKLGKHPIQCQI